MRSSTLSSKLAKSANPDPPKGSFEVADVAEDENGSLNGSAWGDLVKWEAGGAGRCGAFPAFGGAGRGGGCFDFLGGSAGVGLSSRPEGLFAELKGSLPKGSLPEFDYTHSKSTSEDFVSPFSFTVHPHFKNTLITSLSCLSLSMYLFLH